jgi:hypothetical protein
MSTPIEDQIDRLTAKRQKATGASYSQCYSETLEQHPELYEQYLGAAGARYTDAQRAAERPSLQVADYEPFVPGRATTEQWLAPIEREAKRLMASEHLDFAVAYSRALERDPAAYDASQEGYVIQSYAETHPQAAKQFNTPPWEGSGRAPAGSPDPWSGSGRSTAPSPYKGGSTRSGIAADWRRQDLQGEVDRAKGVELKADPSIDELTATARALDKDKDLRRRCCRY